MRLREKQCGFSNKLITRRGSLSKPSALEQFVDLISGGWEDDKINDRVNDVVKQVKQVKVDKLDAIDNDYLRGIKPLYTWKTLVPECIRSGSYSNTT